MADDEIKPFKLLAQAYVNAVALTAAAAGSEAKPFRLLAGAMDTLAQTVASEDSPPMTIKAFVNACSAMPPMIHLMGPATRFWEEEFAVKVELINRASNHATTLAELIDQDIANNCVRLAGSNCRIILRLKRALEVVKVALQEMQKGRNVSLIDASETAYKAVLARHHDNNTRYTVIEAMSVLPSREVIMALINETEEDAVKEMEKYVKATAVVIDYIDHLFTARELGIDW